MKTNGSGKDRVKRMENRAENRAIRQISRDFVFRGTLGPCPDLLTPGVQARTHACDGLGEIVDIDTEPLDVQLSSQSAHVCQNLDIALAARRPPFRRSLLLNDLTIDRCPPTPLIDCRSLRYLSVRSRPEQQVLRHLPWASRL